MMPSRLALLSSSVCSLFVAVGRDPSIPDECPGKPADRLRLVDLPQGINLLRTGSEAVTTAVVRSANDQPISPPCCVLWNRIHGSNNHSGGAEPAKRMPPVAFTSRPSFIRGSGRALCCSAGGPEDSARGRGYASTKQNVAFHEPEVQFWGPGTRTSRLQQRH